MIKIDTVITVPNKQFENKAEFKNYVIQFVPQDTDPLRVYNFKLMEKYGDGFFYLTFVSPNKGILNHIYQTEEEYKGSEKLRFDQQKELEKKGLKYKISSPYTFNKSALTKTEYYNLHTDLLLPLDIKVDVELFKLEMDMYKGKKYHWGDLYTQYPRYAYPLVNLNGKNNNEIEPACYPLDRWNFIQTGLENTKENFDDFLFNISQFSNEHLFEINFTKPTKLMNFKSLKVLDPIKEYMTRSCILKWDTMGHFNPHFDSWHPTRWLRLWGTTDPDKMKLRYKTGGEANVLNKVTDKWEYYEPVENIEAGRLYLHDSIRWHDAFAYDDEVYQFFISLNIDAYEIIKTRII